jgi:hypothetical protein
VEQALNALLPRIGVDIDTARLEADIEQAGRALFQGAAESQAFARFQSATGATRMIVTAARPSLSLSERLTLAMAKKEEFFAMFLIPFLGFLTIVILAFVGFEAIYVNSAKAFGANPVNDFLTALVWGLSADVAGRTIANVRST